MNGFTREKPRLRVSAEVLAVDPRREGAGLPSPAPKTRRPEKGVLFLEQVGEGVERAARGPTYVGPVRSRPGLRVGASSDSPHPLQKESVLIKDVFLLDMPRPEQDLPGA